MSISGPSTLSVVEGQSVELICSATGLYNCSFFPPFQAPKKWVASLILLSPSLVEQTSGIHPLSTLQYVHDQYIEDIK